MGRLFPLWLVVVLAASSLTAWAQFPRERPVLPGDVRVLSGADVGFRVEGTDPRSGHPVGTWVVRVDGQWVEAGAKPVLRPAK